MCDWESIKKKPYMSRIGQNIIYRQKDFIEKYDLKNVKNINDKLKLNLIVKNKEEKYPEHTIEISYKNKKEIHKY